jgi:hypothetical protein
MATKKGLNPEWLKGLVFTGANKEETKKEDGRRHVQYTPFKRPATEADVNNWADKGDTVVIVLNDGKKYTVKK